MYIHQKQSFIKINHFTNSKIVLKTGFKKRKKNFFFLIQFLTKYI